MGRSSSCGSGSNFNSENLNCDISYDEVAAAVESAKLGKAFLFVPNEALKNDTAKRLLHKLFNVCFKSGFSPQDWLKSELKPLFKGGDKTHVIHLTIAQYVSCHVLQKSIRVF